MTGSFRLRIGIISVVIGGHFGGGDHFDGGDHFGGGTGLRPEVPPLTLLNTIIDRMTRLLRVRSTGSLVDL